MKYGYARVSTTDQSLDLQLDALRREGCSKIFHDHGVSGAENRQRGLGCLLNDLRKGDQLIVWKLDRLGRSLAFLSRLLDELNSAGVEFKSITDGIDTTTASGKLMFHVIGALSAFERTLISERTKEGMKAAKSRGIHVGGVELAGTINGLYKTEVIYKDGPWKGLEDVERATLTWVDWFNNRRLLSARGDMPPVEF